MLSFLGGYKMLQKNLCVTNVKVILEGSCNECIKKR